MLKTEHDLEKSEIKKRIYPIAAFLLFIVLWEVLVRLTGTPEYRLPAPTAVFGEFVDSWDILLGHTAVTLAETLLGFVSGTIVAIGFAMMVDYSNLVERIFMPFAVLSQTIPLVALAPLLAIWFGFGMLPKIILVILVVFFPVAVSLAQGFRSVDRDLLEMMEGIDANKRQIFFKLKVPNAAPYFFSGLRISAAYAVMGAVISEWTGASKGLGIFMTRAMSSFRTAALFADIIIISILSILLFKLIGYIERKTIKWQ